MDAKIVKQEASGMKAAIIDNGTLEENEKFFIKLYSDGTAHFMSIDKANELSKLIRMTIDLYFAEKREDEE